MPDPARIKAAQKIAVIALLAFAIPICFATQSNWSNIEPFVIGSPETSRGTLLYFAKRG